ncbi:sortase [Candidatus Parcubacteria bacterium]|nr:sortase [Candidatus Parcubacteria bacterium]
MRDLNFMESTQYQPTQVVQKKIWPTLAVFGSSFAFLMVAINAPGLISHAKYATESDESHNEQLTTQYRALYGYESHPADFGSGGLIKAAPTQESIIRIDKIHVEAPILQPSSDEDNAILSVLKDGVALYPGSAMPGQSGTTVIVGHSSSNPPWTKYSAIFSLLDKLNQGDLIVIDYGGVEYTYFVQSKVKGSVQQIMTQGVAGDLILSSCWPVGTDSGRIVITANLQP